MKLVLLTALAATSMAATPALAGNGTGGRFEARIGGERLTLDARLTDGTDTFSDSGSDSGVALGIEAGYDFPLGRAALIGAYAGIDGGTTKECVSDGYFEDCLLVGRNLTVGGRLGVRVTPVITLYGKAGYSNGQLRYTSEDYSDPTVIWKAKANRGGVHFGGGFEGALSNSTYLKGEYVRTNYRKYKESGDGVEASLGSHRDQLLMGFGLRF